ncbi:MAG: uroporphyrinogen decarboxylase family protein [Thermomicrobiales bacterium]
MASRSGAGRASAGSGFVFDEMTRTERVMAAVRGEPVDRLPICFWHHFRPEGSGRALAEATLRFFDEKFDLDILKIMPDLPYPFPRKSIQEPNDWRLIEPIDVERSRFFTQRAESVRALRDEVGYEVPIIVTLFNPLCEAIYFAADRDRFFAHAQESPTVIHEALSVIAENLRSHIHDVIDAGADGVFFALQGCTKEIMSEAQYREFGRPYDLIALQGALNGWLNVLHVHGDKDLHFDLVLDYPVQVLSWSDRIAGPSLREARGMTSKCLMGGWNEFGALSNGPEDKILEEARDAVVQTGGRKFILANGCSVPDETDEKWLNYAREVVEQLDVD